MAGLSRATGDHMLTEEGVLLRNIPILSLRA